MECNKNILLNQEGYNNEQDKWKSRDFVTYLNSTWLSGLNIIKYTYWSYVKSPRLDYQ